MRMSEQEYQEILKRRQVSTPAPIYRTPDPGEKAPLEHAEQCKVIKWANDNLIEFPALRWLYAVPNGQAKFSKKLQAYYKAEGLKSGVCDLVLPTARGGFHGLYIEMKRIKGSTISDNQKEFMAFVEDEGYFVRVAKGGSQAIEFLQHYLALPKTVVEAIALADNLF